MNKIISSILIGLMLFSGVASAQTADLPSAGMTPGSRFFFADRFFEGVGTLFTFGNVAKAKRFVAIAEERLAEARELAEQGYATNAERAVNLYEEKLADATERAKQAKNADTLARVTEATNKHFAVLEDVIERVPEQAKASVQRALESSRQGQVSALKALTEEDPSRAVDVGVNAAKYHLERAKANAVKQNNAGVEIALADFEALLNIANDAQGGKSVLIAKYSERLNEVIGDLDFVEEISANLPTSIKNRIEQVKTHSINSQLSSLRELVREDPRRAVEIFTAGADARLNDVKENVEKQNGEATEGALKGYGQYKNFGEELSKMAQGNTTVEDLVNKATSRQLQVFKDVRQNLPPEAQKEFQSAFDSAVDNARKMQKLLLEMPTRQPGQIQPGDEQSFKGMSPEDFQKLPPKEREKLFREQSSPQPGREGFNPDQQNQNPGDTSGSRQHSPEEMKKFNPQSGGREFNPQMRNGQPGGTTQFPQEQGQQGQQGQQRGMMNPNEMSNQQREMMQQMPPGQQQRPQ